MDWSFFDKAFYIGFFAGILGVILEGVFCAIKYHRWESHVTTVWGWYNIVYGLGAGVLYAMAARMAIPSLFWKIVVMTLIVTAVEFAAGLLLKYAFGMKAWDYSKQPGNIMGLICPVFSLGWAALSLGMCLISDKLTEWLEPVTITPLHIFAEVFFILLTLDFLLAMLCVYRWSRRHYGKAAQTTLGLIIDKYANDEWISSRFVEWEFLDGKAQVKDRPIAFTTPSIFENADMYSGFTCFGCASYGFAGSPDPKKDAVKKWGAQHKNIKGHAYFGTLMDVLVHIPAKATVDGKSVDWQAGIVLFGNCGEENAFIRKLQEKTGCPFTGGAAACNPDTGKSGLIVGNGEVAVYMISDPDIEVSVESSNIHTNILGSHKIGFRKPRVIDTIDGEDAVTWFTKKRAEYGFGAEDFEHMTFSDMNGVNAHLSMEGGRLVSGRDLCPEMVLRYVKNGDVYPQMNEFYDDKDAMIFGCAGLKGILEQDIMTDTMGMFMFGEVVTVNNTAEFGNLMLSKLVVKNKNA